MDDINQGIGAQQAEQSGGQIKTRWELSIVFTEVNAIVVHAYNALFQENCALRHALAEVPSAYDRQLADVRAKNTDLEIKNRELRAKLVKIDEADSEFVDQLKSQVTVLKASEYALRRTIAEQNAVIDDLRAEINDQRMRPRPGNPLGLSWHEKYDLAEQRIQVLEADERKVRQIIGNMRGKRSKPIVVTPAPVQKEAVVEQGEVKDEIREKHYAKAYALRPHTQDEVKDPTQIEYLD